MRESRSPVSRVLFCSVFAAVGLLVSACSPKAPPADLTPSTITIDTANKDDVIATQEEIIKRQNEEMKRQQRELELLRQQEYYNDRVRRYGK